MYNIIVDVTGRDVRPGDEVLMECNPILLSSSVERKYV